MPWRIYYDDGSIHDWTQGTDDLEPYGVICILQRITDPGGERWTLNYGAPFYCLDGDEWVILQHNDVEDRLAHRLPIGVFLVGRAVTKAKFSEIFERAKKDRSVGLP